jgi:hypothetical protein
MLRHQQFVRTLALAGLATAAMFAPHAASARPVADVHGTQPARHALVDLRSPDAATPVQIQPTKVDLRSPDAATPVQIQPTKVDLRSPDAATPVQIQPTQVDLRSPDAVTPVHAPTAPAPQPQTVGTPSSDTFDYGSAAIGAGIALLVALACAGSMIAVNRRRNGVSFS